MLIGQIITPTYCIFKGTVMRHRQSPEVALLLNVKGTVKSEIQLVEHRRTPKRGNQFPFEKDLQARKTVSNFFYKQNKILLQYLTIVP